MGAEEIDLEEDARRYALKVYLLDTCTLLWATNKPEQLSVPARAIWNEPNGMIAVSVINYWEVANKAEKHGIADIAKWWEHRVMPFVDLETIQVREEHVTEMLRLPKLHKDPFDRMLIAQARIGNMTLVTPDTHIQAYDVRTVW